MAHSHDHEHKRIWLTHECHYFLGIFIFLVSRLVPFPYEISQILTIIAILLSGYHVIIEGVVDTIHQTRLRKKLSPNTHILMTLAALGAILLGETTEAALLIFIFAGAHFLEAYVAGKSSREITKLLAMNPSEARKIASDGTITLVSVEQLNVGEFVQVQNGDQIPTDGVIVSGNASIDEAAINGESIPREKVTGDEVFAATINGNSTFVMVVTKASEDTVFAKIVKLVTQSQTQLSKAATGIQKFEPVYVNIVLCIFILLLLGVPFIFNWSWSETVSRSLVFLVSVSPCAIAVSVIPATLAGISNLAREGILFKGGNFLSNFINLKVVAFDKTGTLTQGKPQVVDYEIAPKFEYVLAIVAAMEAQSNHPLATAIVNQFPNYPKDSDLSVTQVIGQGLTTVYEGREIQIAKPTAFSSVEQKWQDKQLHFEKQGKTVVLIAVDQQVIGLIAIQDIPQPDAMSVIHYLKTEQIQTIMITGDTKRTGEAIGDLLEIDTVISDVLPDQKSAMISETKAKYGMIGMVGDGINDAPALAVSDIGIAMGDGTDVAIETADVVLMENKLLSIVKAHRVSKRLKQIIYQNIIFALIIVVMLVTLGLLGRVSVVSGVMVHEGSTLVVLLNSLRLLIPGHEK